MSEFVLNISQCGFIQELANTPSLSEKIKKLDDCIGRIEESKKACAEKVKQHEEYGKRLEEYEKQLEEQKNLLDKNMKEIHDEAGVREIELTFFRTLRQKLVEFSSAPPPESSMQPPIDPLALSLGGSVFSSRSVYPPPPESFVPPPTNPFTTAQSRFVYPPPQGSFVPPPTHPFTTAQSRFVYPPPQGSFMPPPQGSFMPPPTHFFTTAQPRFVNPPPPESRMPPPTYFPRPPAFPVPPPPTASNFPQPSLVANPPWVSSGPPFPGPQRGPLYGPVAPVQERVAVLEPRVRFQWTEERARSFNEAVIALGGLHNATPKSIKEVMDINEEVTEKQISSRLQKLRGKLPI